MASRDVQASEAARKKGNDFYRQQKLIEAEQAYNEAAKLAPQDPAPLSNLSALYFEKGQYKDAVDQIRKALALFSHAATPNDPQTQKLHTRLAKSCILMRDLEGAREAIDRVPGGTSCDELRDALEATESLWATYPDTPGFRKQVLDRFSGFKPPLDDIPEYYAVGHDDASSLFDRALKESITNTDNLALMFCGSGDARHLLATLVDLYTSEAHAKKKAFGKAHITILDLKPASLGRTLLLFSMLYQYTTMKATKQPGHKSVLIAMAYLYAGVAFPPYVTEMLRHHLDTLLETLETGGSMFGFIYLAPTTQVQVTRVLRQWKGSLPPKLSINKVRRAVSIRIQLERARIAEAFGKRREPSYKGHKADRKSFDHLGVLFAPDGLIEKYEPGLVSLLADYRGGGNGKSASTKRLEEYIDAHWEPNFTLIDIDHTNRLEFDFDDLWKDPTLDEATRRKLVELGPIPSIEFEPLEMAEKLGSIPHPPGDEPGLLSDLSARFNMVALSIISLGTQRVMIEMVCDEMTTFAERLRYGLLEYRVTKSSGEDEIDPTQFPRVYDRVHMSNIPDYTGGHLTTFLHLRPLLSESRASNLRFNNLLNPPVFGCHENFEAEYLLLRDPKQISSHFFVRRRRKDNMRDGLPDIAPMMGPAIAAMMDAYKKDSFLMEDYFIWDRLKLKPLPWGQRMSRLDFERWVYGHLLKLCIPFPRPPRSNAPVMASTNLTLLPRLLAHAASLGYPAHWISSIVAACCQGRITTTARAPRGLPVTPEALAHVHPPRTMSVAPFRAELATVFAVWRRLLPWGLLAPLAPPARVRRYAVRFPPPPKDDMRVPHFVLAFWDTAVVAPAARPRERAFYATVLDDEEGDAAVVGGPRRRDETRRIRDEGLHILSAFRYVTDERTAEFWLLEDVMERMRGGKWVVNIARTDVWVHVTEHVSVDLVTELEHWTDPS